MKSFCRHILYFTPLVLLLFSCEGTAVTDYFFLTVCTPQPNVLGGSTLFSEREFDVEELGRFSSDSIAVRKGENEATQRIDFYTAYYDSVFKKEPKGVMQQFERKVNLQAAKEIFARRYFLIAVTHKKRFNSDQYFNIIKEHGIICKEIDEYVKKNKLAVKIYPLARP